ncbi:MAG: GNAT family N-acetyltransferase, partial [Hyphococcus sp.]
LAAPFVERRHGFVRARQLRLNEAGPAVSATLFAENNGLLTAKGCETGAWRAALSALQASGAPVWDEVIVPCAYTALETETQKAGYIIHRRAQYPSAHVDLDGLRAGGACDLDGYLSTLSANTRRQINRAIALYKERGALVLARAASLEEALAWFEDVVRLHTVKWRARGIDQPAKTAYLRQFHRAFIKRAFAKGRVEMARVSAGAAPIAWIYNFLEGDRVLFNMAGLCVEDDNRLKPGLVAHALLIADHLQAGKAVYDFLAGGDRYKFSLGQSGPDYVEFAVQQSRLSLNLERALRRVKRDLGT